MDRRDFFKAVITTPLITPLFFASKSSAYDELFLISNKPQILLPPLLEELGRLKIISEKKFAFSNLHPQKRTLIPVLERHGWRHMPPSSRSNLSLSYHPLQHPTSCSFVLVRSGKILDIRFPRLRSLWQEINSNHAPSSCLTIASLQTGLTSLNAGETVRVYKDGRRMDDFSLKIDRVRTFQTRQGTITLRIKGRKVWVPESSCRHRICCFSPPISLVGERIVCAPNHFLVEIRGPGMVDTVVG